MRDVRRPNVVCFGPFQLDITAGELYGESHRIPLQEQPFQLLKMLVDQPGEVLTREHIRSQLWPNGTIVEFDHSINTAVKKLRLALGDSAAEPRYVETVARRGYRLMVPANRLEPTPAASVRKPAATSEFELPAVNQTGKKVSHYRVLEILGGGGMGVVYAAEDIKLGRRVALKFLPQELGNDAMALERFGREARAASSLNHSNICTVHEFGEHEGQPFIVMELLAGQTLRNRIGSGGALQTGELLDVGMQICGGLEAAHEKSIIHGDIKPANIFLTDRREAKILDFGLAQLLGPEIWGEAAGERGRAREDGLPIITENRFLTIAGVAFGTPAYMSPEQARGEKVDARTDLFSFGLMLYEMATGRQAFTGETVPILREAILNSAPPSARALNPELPVRLEEIIAKALEKDRQLRYQTASEIQTSLQGLKREMNPARKAPPKTPRWWLVPVGVVALLLTAGAIFWLGKKQSSSEPELPHLRQRQLTTANVENPVWGGAISPDGKYVAYSDGKGIHCKLLATGTIQNIPQPESLKGGHVDWRVCWLPDAKRLIANASVPGQRDSAWIVSVMDGALRKLRDDASPSSVSPDGDSIAFTTNRGRYGDREIWLMGLSGENARKLYETDENSGFDRVGWSPDGRRVAYIRNHETPNDGEAAFFPRHAFTITVESRDLKGNPPVTILSRQSGELRDFIWLADGRIILLFAEPDINLYSCNYWEQKMDAATGEPQGKLRQLTNWAGFCMDQTSATADGKRLAFKRWWVQRSVYIADFESNRAQITTPHRLTHTEGNELPMGWTADGESVIFVSNRTGSWGIFRQSLQEDMAETIVTELEKSVVPSTSPDGTYVTYVASPKTGSFSSRRQLMRVPIVGGPPQPVLTANLDGQRCAKSPSTLCVMGERTADHKQLVFTQFHPLKGRGPELTRFDIDPNADYPWDLSPDGSRIAVQKSMEGRIHILSLVGGAPLEINTQGWGSFETLNWAADGKGFFGASRTQQTSVLLYVDLRGSAHVLWEQKGTLGNEAAGTSGIPSPNGRHLAMMGFTLNANIWIINGFE